MGQRKRKREASAEKRDGRLTAGAEFERQTPGERKANRGDVLYSRDAAEIAASHAEEFRERLLAWFRRHRRDLPWRRTSDAYKIWLSEIMLQQTRVAAVIPYYERFLVGFPTIQSLADAPEQEVLRLWSGLGYYSRARNLQRAARKIVSEHNGVFPRREEEILALPGIGRYTAAAIQSIAFGQKRAVLDGNVARVLARIGAVRGDLRALQRWRALQKSADQLLEANAPGDWNQAMMELGATLCTPRAPQCSLCPVAEFCRARRLGIADSLPEKRAKPMTVEVTLAAAIFLDARRRTLLLPPPQRAIDQAHTAAPQRRSSGSGNANLQHGDVPALVSRMWHFPTVSAFENPQRELLHFLERAFPAKRLQPNSLKRSPARFSLEPLPTGRHTVTYRRTDLRPFLIRVARLPRIAGAQKMPLSDVCTPVSLAISNLTRKCARCALAASGPTAQASRPRKESGQSVLATLD